MFFFINECLFYDDILITSNNYELILIRIRDLLSCLYFGPHRFRTYIDIPWTFHRQKARASQISPQKETP